MTEWDLRHPNAVCQPEVVNDSYHTFNNVSHVGKASDHVPVIEKPDRFVFQDRFCKAGTTPYRASPRTINGKTLTPVVGNPKQVTVVRHQLIAFCWQHIMIRDDSHCRKWQAAICHSARIRSNCSHTQGASLYVTGTLQYI